MVAESPAPPEDLLDTGLLAARVVLPWTFGAFLVGGAPLVWSGARGNAAALLGLFYGGILAILVGLVLAFLVGLFVWNGLALTGILWIALERVALQVGAPFGWSAVAMAALGVVLMVRGYRPLRRALDRQRQWQSVTGGSVAPPGPPGGKRPG